VSSGPTLGYIVRPGLRISKKKKEEEEAKNSNGKKKTWLFENLFLADRLFFLSCSFFEIGSLLIRIISIHSA
jgi:hypothetical protein